MLFVNAGTANHDQGATIAEVTTGEFVRVMVTNALSPMRVVEGLQHLVTDDGLIGVMSSGQGSVADNEKGGREIYRGSKAALNQYMRSYAARDTSRGGAPIELRAFANGKLAAASAPVVPGFAAGDTLKNAAFSPTGALALVYATRPRLSLFQVVTDGGVPKLTRWGEDVPLGPTPFEVRFTADGRFALVNDMTVPKQGTVVRGAVTSIAIAASRIADGQPVHRVVSRARTGVQPEGLTISPDGRWTATTNLERTAYVARDPHQGFFASVTLLRLDPATGELTRVGDFPFAGVIPEAAQFDNGSRFLAVTSFDHLGPGAGRASLDIWRIAGDFQDLARVELAPTGVSIPIPRGAQSMEIAR